MVRYGVTCFLSALLSVTLAVEGAELARLRETLLQPSDRSYGLSVPENDARLQAIQALGKDGSPEAVAVLQEFLTTHGAGHKLKIHALVTLGQIGTKEAVEAIGRFEAWARTRVAQPPPFRFGRHDWAIDHFAPHELKPLARATDEKGKAWAVFLWRRYGWQDLWLTSALDKDTWAPPLLIGLPKPSNDPWHTLPDAKGELTVKGGSVRVVVDGQAVETTLEQLTADADKDGLPDRVEARLETDPKEPDSDGDGVPDGQDPNPLTPKHKQADDEAEIRQAVFTVLFATCGSRDAVVIAEKRQSVMKELRKEVRRLDEPPRDPLPEGHFARQEYYGFGGFVLRSPGIRHGFVNITAITVKLDSPTTATATISDWEGGLAASGHEAKLKKLHGRWVVVAFRMTWIS